MTAYPLLPAAPAETPLACQQGRLISRAEFLGKVQALAAHLPAGRPVINLCADRYHFALGLFASISQGCLSLLPNALTRETIASLLEQYPDLLCLSDQGDSPFNLPQLRINADQLDGEATNVVPQIPAEQEIACVFTSGSTGQPQPHLKRWGSLVANIRAEVDRLWEAAGGPCSVLGTVPFQHMYGLESTVLLPLFGQGILGAERPFFPADIAAALERLPEPRLLVTTPLHLRTLLEAGLSFPKLQLVLSATAPMPPELAARAEAGLGAPLLEIYGATETGQLATRQTTAGEIWRTFDGICLRQQDRLTLAHGGHIEGEGALNDVVELVDATHFRLLGRSSDMVNIAGKRSSLAFLNHVLGKQPEVRDGVFCLPDPDSQAPRLAAFVVAPGIAAGQILQGLREHIDPVFLPRPIVFLDSLPRNETGKLPQAELTRLITEHLTETRDA